LTKANDPGMIAVLMEYIAIQFLFSDKGFFILKEL
jgi:hypothetical protein